MKKIILSLLLSGIAITPTLLAQDKLAGKQETKIDGAQFKFKDGDVFDFGTVPSGPDVTHEFLFTNTG